MSKISLQERSLKEQDDVFGGLCRKHLEFVNKVAELSIALVCYMEIFARKKRQLGLNTEKTGGTGKITLPTPLFPSYVH